MKKALQNNTIYKTVSASEGALLAAISDSGLASFGLRELRAIGGWGGHKVGNTVSSLVRKGHLARLVRGRLAASADISSDPLRVARSVAAPAYVSFWTALSIRGLTEQQTSAIQLVSTRQYRGFSVGGHAVEVARFKPSRFYGYDASGVASPEKALVDSLFTPARCGGLGEVAKCIGAARGRVGARGLAACVARFGSRSLASRAGYLAREAGFGELPGLSRSISKGFVRLDPSGGRPFAYDREWRVAVNWRLP